MFFAENYNTKQQECGSQLKYLHLIMISIIMKAWKTLRKE